MALLPENWPLLPPEEISLLAPLQSVSLPVFDEAGLDVMIKREDLLHPLLGGNKVYKLLGHIAKYQKLGRNIPIVSFGGAYSNHLIALAAAGQCLDVKTMAIVRGEPGLSLSPTLSDAMKMGMDIHYVPRGDYRKKNTKEFRDSFCEQLGDVFWVPEGGSGPEGVVGCVGLGVGLKSLGAFDVVCHACGTGASLVGIACGIRESVTALGVAVVKGDLSPMRKEVSEWQRQLGYNRSNWDIHEGYACGGYGKLPSDLRSFITEFRETTGIPLDAVYTAKLMKAIVSLAKTRFWRRGTRILVIHSGGIQGNRGFSLS